MTKKKVKHMYYCIEDTTLKEDGTVGGMVGSFLVQDGHVRAQHEPERVWQFMNMTTGEGTYMVGVHVGEYEKVKDYCKGWLDYNQIKPVYDVAKAVVKARDDYDEGRITDEKFLDAMAELESVVNTATEGDPT